MKSLKLRLCLVKDLLVPDATTVKARPNLAPYEGKRDLSRDLNRGKNRSPRLSLLDLSLSLRPDRSRASNLALSLVQSLEKSAVLNLAPSRDPNRALSQERSADLNRVQSL